MQMLQHQSQEVHKSSPSLKETSCEHGWIRWRSERDRLPLEMVIQRQQGAAVLSVMPWRNRLSRRQAIAQLYPIMAKYDYNRQKDDTMLNVKGLLFRQESHAWYLGDARCLILSLLRVLPLALPILHRLVY